jgi:hypothetical protein
MLATACPCSTEQCGSNQATAAAVCKECPALLVVVLRHDYRSEIEAGDRANESAHKTDTATSKAVGLHAGR